MNHGAAIATSYWYQRPNVNEVTRSSFKVCTTVLVPLSLQGINSELRVAPGQVDQYPNFYCTYCTVICTVTVPTSHCSCLADTTRRRCVRVGSVT